MKQQEITATLNTEPIEEEYKSFALMAPKMRKWITSANEQICDNINNNETTMAEMLQKQESDFMAAYESKMF